MYLATVTTTTVAITITTISLGSIFKAVFSSASKYLINPAAE